MYRHGPYAKQTSMEFGTRPAIGSFLENRKQEVVLDGSHSDWADVLSGVPQFPREQYLGPCYSWLTLATCQRVSKITRL